MGRYAGAVVVADLAKDRVSIGSCVSSRGPHQRRFDLEKWY